MSELTLQTEGERVIVVKRRFSAPPAAVYRAHTDCDWVQRWLLGPEGWTMPVCINEARPGGQRESTVGCYPDSGRTPPAGRGR